MSAHLLEGEIAPRNHLAHDPLDAVPVVHLGESVACAGNSGSAYRRSRRSVAMVPVPPEGGHLADPGRRSLRGCFGVDSDPSNGYRLLGGSRRADAFSGRISPLEIPSDLRPPGSWGAPAHLRAGRSAPDSPG